MMSRAGGGDDGVIVRADRPLCMLILRAWTPKLQIPPMQRHAQCMPLCRYIGNVYKGVSMREQILMQGGKLER